MGSLRTCTLLLAVSAALASTAAGDSSDLFQVSEIFNIISDVGQWVYIAGYCRAALFWRRYADLHPGLKYPSWGDLQVLCIRRRATCRSRSVKRLICSLRNRGCCGVVERASSQPLHEALHSRSVGRSVAFVVQAFPLPHATTS